MNGELLFKQLSLMGSSFFPEAGLTVRHTSLGPLCLLNAAFMSRLSQRSARPQCSGCDPHLLLCYYLTSMDRLT